MLIVLKLCLTFAEFDRQFAVLEGLNYLRGNLAERVDEALELGSDKIDLVKFLSRDLR